MIRSEFRGKTGSGSDPPLLRRASRVSQAGQICRFRFCAFVSFSRGRISLPSARWDRVLRPGWCTIGDMHIRSRPLPDSISTHGLLFLAALAFFALSFGDRILAQASGRPGQIGAPKPLGAPGPAGISPGGPSPMGAPGPAGISPAGPPPLGAPGQPLGSGGVETAPLNPAGSPPMGAGNAAPERGGSRLNPALSVNPAAVPPADIPDTPDGAADPPKVQVVPGGGPVNGMSNPAGQVLPGGGPGTGTSNPAGRVLPGGG